MWLGVRVLCCSLITLVTVTVTHSLTHSLTVTHPLTHPLAVTHSSSPTPTRHPPTHSHSTCTRPLTRMIPPTIFSASGIWAAAVHRAKIDAATLSPCASPTSR